jgi:hypothetical protein
MTTHIRESRMFVHTEAVKGPVGEVVHLMSSYVLYLYLMDLLQMR